MSPITFLYHELIYRPLLNGLVFLYALLPYRDLGLAIIILTAIVRALLHPTMVQTIRSQQAMARIGPKLREIQEQFRDNKEEQARRTMTLYRQEGIHPLSGCIPILIQLPILIGLYQVFWKGIAAFDPTLIYSFLPSVQTLNPIAFGIFDLSRRSIILAIVAGASQFLQGRFLVPPPAAGKAAAADFGRAMQWQMTYFFPFFIVAISWSLPAALALYWTVFNLFAIVQQLWIQKRINHEHHLRTPQLHS